MCTCTQCNYIPLFIKDYIYMLYLSRILFQKYLKVIQYICVFFSSIESTIRKLTKEMKKYIGALVNLDRADQRLSMNLISCGLTQSNDEYRRIVEEYFSVATQVS